jgi:NAD(P)-dependent dehydrogenase (short-subunit alcohol dehydrogenase family)
MGQLDGRVAIVTGGASGIGAACAETLAREGARVVATDLDDAGGAAVAGKIKAAGGTALFLHHDVTDEARWAEVIAETEKAHGRLDIMVANAGIGISAPTIVDVKMEDWRRQTAINIDGVFLSVRDLGNDLVRDLVRMDRQEIQIQVHVPRALGVAGTILAFEDVLDRIERLVLALLGVSHPDPTGC